MTEPTCPICLAVVPDGKGPRCPHCGFDLQAGVVVPGWVRKGVDLRTVARRQRMLLWFFLVSLPLNGGLCFPMWPASRATEVSLAITWLVVHTFIVVSVVQLLSALRRHILVRMLYILLLFLPYFGLLMLLAANQQATRALSRAGLRVGLLGVPDEQVVRLLGLYRCRACGYSLIGNTSGRCPECGTPVAGVW